MHSPDTGMFRNVALCTHTGRAPGEHVDTLSAPQQGGWPEGRVSMRWFLALEAGDNLPKMFRA